MATITGEKRRTGGDKPRLKDSARTEGRIKSTASTWLAHPLASQYLIGVPTLLLLSLGIVMVWSASSVFGQTQFGDPNYFLKRQLIFAPLGLALAFAMTRIPLETLKRLGWAMFAGAGLLMCVPFVMGKRIKGNLNWIDFGPMLRFQPSEVAKIVIILWGATLFTSKRKALDDPVHLLVPFLPGSLALIVLTVLQHDLGTSIIMGIIVAVMIWNVGGSMRILGAFAGLVSAGVLALVVTGQAYRLQRILGFLDPTFDPNGINYQPNQAQFGLATGGWWGVGLGYGRMKWGYLSEAHTDFIIAVIGEELGVVGTLSVIVLFVVLAYAGFRTAVRAGSFYARIVAAGITCWITLQALVNIAMVLRLLPVVGVPLPLISYGGSSLTVNLAAIGILVRCSREEPEAKEFLARQQKSPNPRARLSAVLPARRRRA